MLGGFLTLFASRRMLAQFRQLIVAHENDNSVVAGDEFMASVSHKYFSRFYGFMMTLSHGLGLRRQRFFVTFMARYHGLSLLGGDILSSIGMIMPSTNYDLVLKEVVQDAQALARYTVTV